MCFTLCQPFVAALASALRRSIAPFDLHYCFVFIRKFSQAFQYLIEISLCTIEYEKKAKAGAEWKIVKFHDSRGSEARRLHFTSFQFFSMGWIEQLELVLIATESLRRRRNSKTDNFKSDIVLWPLPCAKEKLKNLKCEKEINHKKSVTDNFSSPPHKKYKKQPKHAPYNSQLLSAQKKCFLWEKIGLVLPVMRYHACMLPVKFLGCDIFDIFVCGMQWNQPQQI